VPLVGEAKGGSFRSQKVFKNADELLCQSLLFRIGEGIEFLGVQYLVWKSGEGVMDVFESV
jgi:hypothetical protein